MCFSDTRFHVQTKTVRLKEYNQKSCSLSNTTLLVLEAPSFWKKYLHHKDHKAETRKDPRVLPMPLYSGEIRELELNYMAVTF
jgi:hypothetical protein